MSRIRQNFLLFIYFINISLLIACIPNLAHSYDDLEDVIEGEDALFVDITSQDYIDKHVDAKSRKIIQAYKEKCILLQQKGDPDVLLNEINYLSSRAFKKISKNKLTKEICLAIVEKIYFDPVTIILNKIIHAPLEEAYNYVESLRFQIIGEAAKEAITTKEWCIKKYGFDLFNVACNHYMSRNDSIDITQYESIFSDNIKYILSIIQHKSLPIAYAELIHLKKQIIEHLESHNITDPVAQKEFIIKNFSCDIIELARNIYRGRLDQKTLFSCFRPVDVQNSIIKMLNNSEHSYTYRIRFIHDLANDVFQNAELSGFDMIKLKSCIYQAFNIIEKPCNNAEFISNMTLINNVLNEIQHKVYNIVHGKIILSKNHPEDFTRAIEKFLTKSELK